MGTPRLSATTRHQGLTWYRGGEWRNSGWYLSSILATSLGALVSTVGQHQCVQLVIRSWSQLFLLMTITNTISVILVGMSVLSINKIRTIDNFTNNYILFNFK